MAHRVLRIPEGFTLERTSLTSEPRVTGDVAAELGSECVRQAL